MVSEVKYTPAEEFANSFTHFIGAILSIFAIVMLAVNSHNALTKASTAIFGATLFILLQSSALYHAMVNETAKKVFDVAFNCFFILLNFTSILLLLGYMATKKKEVSLGLIEDLDYGHHYTRILLMLIVNSLLFIESFLIVFDVVFIYEIFNIDLLYLTSCLDMITHPY